MLTDDTEIPGGGTERPALEGPGSIVGQLTPVLALVGGLHIRYLNLVHFPRSGARGFPVGRCESLPEAGRVT